ncbi:hypothetical protein FOZ63_023240, partial [Perkinsus olseni]
TPPTFSYLKTLYHHPSTLSSASRLNNTTTSTSTPLLILSLQMEISPPRRAPITHLHRRLHPLTTTSTLTSTTTYCTSSMTDHGCESTKSKLLKAHASLPTFPSRPVKKLKPSKVTRSTFTKNGELLMMNYAKKSPIASTSSSTTAYLLTTPPSTTQPPHATAFEDANEHG